VNANAGCATAVSNRVAMTVNAVPQLAQGPAVSLQGGQNATLDPVLTGNTAGYIYSWSPVAGLSDATIENPIANPSVSTVYTLLVTTGEGCKASTEIKVDVFTQLRIPNAFTPNGDGHNDVFYVLGGLQGTVIRRFTVFDRWGQLVFQAQDSQPGDASLGWNGNYRGAPCPTGAYVYFISVSLADGSIHDYKGTVMLVR
jgi:gliding motility-associated-like protein